MGQKAPLKFYHKLFFRVYLYYGIILTVFAVLLGTIFLKLYSDNSMNTYKSRLEEQAKSIADRFSEFIITEDYSQVPAYLETLEVVFYPSDIYIISNPDAKKPMSSDMENTNLEDIKLTKKFDKILYEAFNGKSEYIISFSPVYDEVMLAIGVPIHDAFGTSVGAVLLYSQVENQKQIISSSKSLIVISGIAAMLISFVIAILFARKLSHPISVMRRTALELAKGNYDARTNLSLTDELGELARTIDTLADKLLLNEKERNSMEQMRQDFFANVSHELRTPITVVRAYAETLIDGVVTDEEKKQQYYLRMLSECKSMERLVGDLLVLSKMQNPDFIVETEPVNIIQVFEDIGRSAYAIGKKKHINLELQKEKDSYMMLGDYDRLRQMFMVILDNAVKFSPDYSTIHINISTPGKLSISIRDEGIGISSDELPNIFDKFYKSKLRQNAEGSGLGLAIAKQIALKHGGSIQVKSKPGRGTEFIFTFQLLTELK